MMTDESGHHTARSAPGRKLLMAGNHEVDRKTGRMHRHGHDEVGPMAATSTTTSPRGQPRT